MLYYITRVLATKKFANDIKELKAGLEEVRQANLTFHHYTFSDWVFDNANCLKLNEFVKSGAAT